MAVDQHEVKITTLAGEPLDWMQGGTITADRGWSPHVQARIPIAPPTVELKVGARVIIELTQRTGALCFIRDLSEMFTGDTIADFTTAYAGDTIADFTALVNASSWNAPQVPATGRRFDLMLKRIIKKSDEWMLELASAEAAYVDALVARVDASSEGLPTEIDGNNSIDMVRTWHNPQFRLSWSYIGSFLFPDLIQPPLKTEARRAGLNAPVRVQATANAWSTVLDALVGVGQRLFSRGDWALIHSEQTPEATGAITVEHGVNLIEWELTDDLPGSAYVRWAGTDTNPAARPIYSDSPWLILFPWTRVIDVPSPLIGWPRTGVIGTPWDTPAAGFSQQAGLDRSPLRLVTISNYSIMPWSTITYTLPDADEVTTIIDAITWHLGRHQMDIWV